MILYPRDMPASPYLAMSRFYLSHMLTPNGPIFSSQSPQKGPKKVSAAWLLRVILTWRETFT
jgi:hypothetical protein